MERGAGTILICIFAIFLVLAPVFLFRGCVMSADRHTMDLIEGRR